MNDQGSRGAAQNEAQATGAADATGNPSGISLVPGRVEYVSSFRAQQGKKIAVPIRVEPKVFYANERTGASRLASSVALPLTFALTALAWIEFSVIISAIGIGILSFSDPHGASPVFPSRHCASDIGSSQMTLRWPPPLPSRRSPSSPFFTRPGRTGGVSR